MLTLERPSGTDVMSSVLERVPAFTTDSWLALEGYERLLKQRVLNLLETRLLETKRSKITDDDVQACVKQALEQLLDQLRSERQ